MTFELRPIEDGQEMERLRPILTQAFNIEEVYFDLFVQRVGPANMRGIYRGKELLGGLGVYPLGQFFHGQSVPMAGVALVGVRPEERSTGAAKEMMRAALIEQAAAGVPLSVLYASTQAFYRKVGYEQAGSFQRFSTRTADIGVMAREPEMIPVETLHPDRFRELYERSARPGAGRLDRSDCMWERLFQPKGGGVSRAYLVGPESAPEGYVIYGSAQDSLIYFHIEVRDWVALTPAAGRRLWSFFRDHRTLSPEIRWPGPANDPMAMLLAEHGIDVTWAMKWMARILDVKGALEARGYPEGVSGELHLEIQDDLIPANQGRFVLQVEGCRGQVRAGGEGHLRAEVGGLPPLFTGFHHPTDLQRAGRLEAKPAALATAARLFAGPEPWMPEIF